MPSVLDGSSVNPCDIICEGDSALVRKLGGEHVRSTKITRKQQILIEKLRFNSTELIGKPYGLFEVNSGIPTPISLRKIMEDDKKEINETTVGISENAFVMAPSGDRTELKEAQARQKYSEQEIDDLKRSGTSASELVAKLVEGSATFQNRTEYAKSKYIRKKAQKHSDRVFVLKPTIRLLCESYYKKDPERVANLRFDQLGLILQLSGIHSGKKVVVFEQTVGLISSAILERLGGYGALIHLHRGEVAQGIPTLHSMNFSEEIKSVLLPVKIASLIEKRVVEEDFNQREREKRRCAEKVSENKDAENEKMETDPVEYAASLERRAERLEKHRRGYDMIANGDFDSIIIASRTVDPVSVLELLFDKMRPCGTVVIYGPVMQPIVEAHAWLRSKGCVNVQMQDQMFRIHQVLPNRTHPLMSQMVVGGTVVSAIKVIVPQ